MTIKNYSTGATIGNSTSIDEGKYEAYLAASTEPPSEEGG